MINQLFTILALVNGVGTIALMIAFYVVFFAGLFTYRTKSVMELKNHNAGLYRLIMFIAMMFFTEILFAWAVYVTKIQ